MRYSIALKCLNDSILMHAVMKDTLFYSSTPSLLRSNWSRLRHDSNFQLAWPPRFELQLESSPPRFQLQACPLTEDSKKPPNPQTHRISTNLQPLDPPGDNLNQKSSKCVYPLKPSQTPQTTGGLRKTSSLQPLTNPTTQ